MFTVLSRYFCSYSPIDSKIGKLEEWRKAPPESRGRKPKARQFRVQDITMEAITKILGETKRGIFVFVDELKGWISSFNKYRNGGGDLEQWLSLYNGVPITVNRKGEMTLSSWPTLSSA